MAKNKVTVTGMEDVSKRLNSEIKNITGRTKKGMFVVGTFIADRAKKLTPVDEGILIGSQFSQVGEKKDGPFVNIGYTAKYAPFVHEMPETTNFKKSTAENKFLEKAVMRNFFDILEILKRFVKI